MAFAAGGNALSPEAQLMSSDTNNRMKSFNFTAFEGL